MADDVFSRRRRRRCETCRERWAITRSLCAECMARIDAVGYQPPPVVLSIPAEQPVRTIVAGGVEFEVVFDGTRAR